MQLFKKKIVRCCP